MNDLGVAITILGLFFLFTGEPDVWDKLHERAMSDNKQVEVICGK